jgi:hypothetical protein
MNHVYLWTMFVIQVLGVLGSVGSFLKQPVKNPGRDLVVLIGNIALLVWTSVLLWG